MKDFRGKLAVLTGGGSGMGRELAIQLAREGAHVALCDVSEGEMAETKRACEAEAPEGTRITCHLCDVSDEDQVQRFRDEVVAQHDAKCIHLLFNNAGISGGGSFLNDLRTDWEKTFGVCWGGVYYCSRAFVPLLVASDGGHLINTSSVNGFWASLGPGVPHTAYSAAKFAVKGFTEALVNDLRLNAPHVKVSLVMPGHVGTSIGFNSRRVLGKGEVSDSSTEELKRIRSRMQQRGVETEGLSDDRLRQQIEQQMTAFRDKAPLSAAGAATIILDAVREERWRVLVGKDAKRLDEVVREAPEEAYETSMIGRLARR